ncbi:MAG: hypothetical protein ACJ72W_08895 [Actinoallomurus sp.]
MTGGRISESAVGKPSADGPSTDEVPEPTDLGVRWWWAALRRTVGEVQRDCDPARHHEDDEAL